LIGTNKTDSSNGWVSANIIHSVSATVNHIDHTGWQIALFQ
jgi:hypothetical protein